MKEKYSSRFQENLDTMFLVAQEMIPDHGEDSFTSACRANSAMVAVCDGCGGLGSRTYASTRGNTEAYLASRMVSGAIYDWFDRNHEQQWSEGNDIRAGLRSCIEKAYSVGSSYIYRDSKIRGSMVRDFPTTLAMAVAQQVGKTVFLHVIWAGDSRVYMFDEGGLMQLTRDDVQSEDAMSNLSDDGALTNVLSLDGNFELHYKCLKLNKPCLVFAATDGCFGYTPSPMEYEYMLLKAITQASTPELFEQNIKAYISEVTGDDFAFAAMSFRYGTYEELAKSAYERMQFLEDKYIRPLQSDHSNEMIQYLWQEYRVDYERALKI